MTNRSYFLLALILGLASAGGMRAQNSQFTVNPGVPTTSGSDAATRHVNADWKVVWSDEFDGPQLDPAKWNIQVNGNGGGNNSLQYYTDRSTNLHISGGVLYITAAKEKYQGPDGRRDYTSACIDSEHKGDWEYGRIEARIKMPKGKGMWPAFWMMPTDTTYGTWARCGEIDIAEVIGNEPNILYGTLHYGDRWPKNVHTGDKIVLPKGDFSDDFHVFAVEWEKGAIRWYLDGSLYQTQTKWYTKAAPFPAPFDRKFHIILNVAVGGAWPGPPDAGTQFPQTMAVDYVRVYRPAGPGAQ